MEYPEPSQTLDELSSENPREEPQTLESQIEEPVSRVLRPETLGTVGSNQAFAVGEFVWGRIRNHPWWPGRVLDPDLVPEEASRAVRKNPNAVFVSYFGDDSYAWCHPTHLKPFKQVFVQMAGQSVSGSFVTAVRNALEEIGRCVELEMACSCVDVEIPDGFLKQGSEGFAVTSYSPAEFLQLVHDVAKDSMVVNMLEITVLRSWVLAFSRKSGHQRCGVLDLVDKFDLDASPRELVIEDDGGGGGESWIDMPRKPEISEEKYKRRKKRSMAKLIAEMDLNAAEVSDGEEEDENEADAADAADEDEKDSRLANAIVDSGAVEEGMDSCLANANVDNAVAVGEGTGSGKRERKKSKYLSYPYTHLSGGYGKHSVILGDFELKSPKKAGFSSSIPHTGSVNEGNGFEKEEDQKGLVFKLESTSTSEILSEFLATAVDCLHLKWNRLAKTTRGFFAAYRSSFYDESLEFQAHQKRLAECGCMNGKIPADSDGTSKKRKRMTTGETLLTGCSQQGKSATKRKRKKDGADAVSSVELGHDTKDSSEKGKTAQRTKKNEAACAETSLDLGGTVKMNSSGKAQGKKVKVKKSDEDEGTLLDLGHGNSKLVAPGLNRLKRQMRTHHEEIGTPVNLLVETVNGPEEVKTSVVVDAGVINGKPHIDATQVLVESPKVAKTGRKRRKNKETLVPEAPTDVSNRSGVSGRKKKKKKDENKCDRPAALLLSFAAGVTLPSRDEIITAFSQYGSLKEAETEVMKESGCARLVFIRSSDAEKALHSMDKTGVFAPPNASYRVRYLPGNPRSPQSAVPVPDRPLPYIRKNLERMISTLTGPALPDKDAGSSDGLKPDAKENLVGEMQGLLEKVNKLLDGPPPSSSS